MSVYKWSHASLSDSIQTYLLSRLKNHNPTVQASVGFVLNYITIFLLFTRYEVFHVAQGANFIYRMELYDCNIVQHALHNNVHINELCGVLDGTEVGFSVHEVISLRHSNNVSNTNK